MKSIHLSFLLLITVSALSSGCEKCPFDYRNKYTGDYNIIYETSWMHIFDQTSGSSTENFTGKVFYKKQEEGKVRLQYNNTEIAVEVNKKAEVLMCGKVAGKFTKNSFSFYYDLCGSDGHGGSGTMKYSGTKK